MCRICRLAMIIVPWVIAIHMHGSEFGGHY
jgi:hypothetical protein